MKELVQKIVEEMGGFASQMVVTDKGDYIKVWNCLTGSIMGTYNRKLDEVAKINGLVAKRVRTYGDGRISAADWEDRLYKIA